MMFEVVLLFLAILLIVYIVNKYQNKYQSLHGNIFNIIVVTVLVLVVSSMTYVYFHGDFNIKSFGGIVAFLKTYFNWVVSFYHNAGKITGFVLQQDWSPNVTQVRP